MFKLTNQIPDLETRILLLHSLNRKGVRLFFKCYYHVVLISLYIPRECPDLQPPPHLDPLKDCIFQRCLNLFKKKPKTKTLLVQIQQ